MKQFLIIIASMLLFAACGHDDDDDKTERVVLVYMAADNDLSMYVNGDIREMMIGSRELNKHQKLLVFVDNKGQKPYLLEVARGDTVRLKTYNEQASSDVELLKTMLKTVMKRYHSDSYGLVLWGHSDGWIYKDQNSTSQPRRAYGIDVTEDYQWMNIPEMAEALATLPKLDFIFGDCCAFQSVETVYELRHVTDYIIASPAEVPGYGAPYDLVVPALFSNDQAFYQLVVDAYFTQQLDGYRQPFSVVRTSAMDHLAEATRQALASFVPQLADSHYPDVNGLVYYYDRTLFDMNDFIMRFADANVYETWKRVHDEAVIYKTFTYRWVANHVRFSDFLMSENRYGGMSMFVPQVPTKYGDSYKEIITTQNKNINKMQWYTAAGLADLGW